MCWLLSSVDCIVVIYPMGIDLQKKVEGPLHSLISPPLPLEVGPLNPASGSGGVL